VVGVGSGASDATVSVYARANGINHVILDVIA